MKKNVRRRTGSKQEAITIRGEEIVRSGLIQDLGSGRYRVSTQPDGGRIYDVSVSKDHVWTCSCRYHRRGRGRRCKHIAAVQGLVEHIEKAGNGDALEIIISEEDIKCDGCGETDCPLYDVRTKSRDRTSVRFRCRACTKRFTYDPGFKGRHYDAEEIIEALLMIAMGFSPEEAADALSNSRGIRPDPDTIRRWVVDYGALLRRFSDKVVAPRAGRDWAADEAYFKVMDRGMWMFGVMDVQSRFMINFDSDSTKFGFDASDLFEDTIELACKIPGRLTTDKLPGYAKGYENAIARKENSKCIHRKDAGIAKVHINNNIYERFNGTLKPHMKRARGFQTDLPALLTLFLAHYNLFRPHRGIGKKTPVGALGVMISGPNKWKAVIQYAVLHCS